MSLSKKTKNAVDAAKGSAKDLAGRVKDDKDLEVEGKAERAVADLKQAGEKVKDAFRRYRPAGGRRVGRVGSATTRRRRVRSSMRPREMGTRPP
jgi:uncharacterized protein YjbJ (UPF0337 family)